MLSMRQNKTFGLVLLTSSVLLSLPVWAKSVDATPSVLREYPINPEVVTTVQETIVPVDLAPDAKKIYPYQISEYAKNGYGLWKKGPGLASEKRLDLMSADYRGDAVPADKSITRFFTISDIHITDKESPTGGIFLGYKGGSSSAYSGVMMYTTQLLDAAIQTVNALHKQDPINFGISLGDVVNNTQYNELRLYIDVLDGKEINPSSGAHAGAATIDYQMPFKAAGLDKSIPWYQVLGNHDHFWMGTNPVDRYVGKAYTGKDVLKMGNIFEEGGFKKRDFYVGVIDGATPDGDVINVGPVKDTKVKKIVEDNDRRSLSRYQWVHEFFKTSSTPVGHGFDNAGLVDKDYACYSFEPKAAVPLKVIVLNDTQKNSDVELPGKGQGGYGHGSLDQWRYEWLISELDKGQAEGKLMIIAAHVPIGVEAEDSYVGWSSTSYVRESALIAKLHEYPNLILWIAGHRHYNAVTAFKSPDAEHPELGFWEVETSSLRDFPQQLRTFDILPNKDDSITIRATDVDVAVKEGTPAAKSRTYAVAAQELFKNPLPLLPSAAYNADLVKPLSTKMQERIHGVNSPAQE